MSDYKEIIVKEYHNEKGLLTRREVGEELVRCKDCKWWTKQEDSLQGRCALMQSYPTGSWYCANGEEQEHE